MIGVTVLASAFGWLRTKARFHPDDFLRLVDAAKYEIALELRYDCFTATFHLPEGYRNEIAIKMNAVVDEIKT